MTFVGNLLLGIVANLVSVLLSPRPEAPKPGTMDDVDIPRTEEGAEIGAAYGSPWIKSAQIHWWGDFSSEPIRSSSGKKK